jgi:hypothetical protein
MSIVERSGERLARFIDRRKFLKRAAITLFSFATATAISLDQVLTAHASYCSLPIRDVCNCDPPNSKYCNNIKSSYCNGSTCADGCTSDTHGWPSSGGCWCTQLCSNGCYDIYWVCCDCLCSNTLCGCAQAYVIDKPHC